MASGPPSRSNRLSSWLSRRFRQIKTLRTTNPVEGQQQALSSEESPSAITSHPDNNINTTITPSNNSSRARPSTWRRLFLRRRRAHDGRRNSGLEFDDQDDRERGFSPPRHRQPEWMRRLRDDESRVSESSRS